MPSFRINQSTGPFAARFTSSVWGTASCCVPETSKSAWMSSLRPSSPVTRLESALFAVRNYWSKFHIAGNQGEPYPLLIVRPDGARSYALARRAMENWDDEFGYELVEAEKLLDFGREDPQLVEELRSTLRVARLQYAAIREAAARMIAHREAAAMARQPAGLQASLNGGFVQTGTAATINRADNDDNRAGGSIGGFGRTAAGKSFNRAVDDNGQPPGRTDHAVGDLDSASSGAASSPPPTSSPPPSSSPSPTSLSSLSAKDFPISPTAIGQKGLDPSGLAGGSTSRLQFGSTQPSVQPLSEKRGENWALPTYQPNATAYRRTITIYCSAKELTVAGHSSDLRMTVPISSDPVANIDPPGPLDLEADGGLGDCRAKWLLEAGSSIRRHVRWCGHLRTDSAVATEQRF